MNAQDALWALLDTLGQTLWWIKPALAALAFVILVLRAPPHCWAERVGRFACFVGLIGIVLAPWNSAFGPLGDVVFFAGYALTLAHRRKLEAARGEVRPPAGLSSRPPIAVLAFIAIVLLAAPVFGRMGLL